MSDIQTIIAQMTLEEKAALCTGASSWTTTPVERLDLPQLLVSDGRTAFVALLMFTRCRIKAY